MSPQNYTVTILDPVRRQRSDFHYGLPFNVDRLDDAHLLGLAQAACCQFQRQFRTPAEHGAPLVVDSIVKQGGASTNFLVRGAYPGQKPTSETIQAVDAEDADLRMRWKLTKDRLGPALNVEAFLEEMKKVVVTELICEPVEVKEIIEAVKRNLAAAPGSGQYYETRRALIEAVDAIAEREFVSGLSIDTPLSPSF